MNIRIILLFLNNYLKILKLLKLLLFNYLKLFNYLNNYF